MTAPRDSFVINIVVPRQLLLDLICTAVEGGSNYWAAFGDAERATDLDYLKVRVIEHEAHEEGTPRVNRFITALEMANGLERLATKAVEHAAGRNDFSAAGKHLGDALSESGDATTADVVLQMAIFGEVIYG
jgi:hypothetical protein